MSRAERAERKPPVIELTNTGRLSAGEQLLHRLLPAAVVSAGVHLVIACGAFALTYFVKDADAAPPAPRVEVAVDERTDPPPDANLTEENVTLDENRGELTVAEAKLDDTTIETTSTEPEPAGNPDGPLQLKVDSLLVAGSPNPIADVPGSDATAPGAGMTGGGSFGVAVENRSLAGRGESTTRDALVRTGGGNSESEAAVAAGLAWLARAQKRNGTWEFDGRSQDRAAATGMGLLPFLAAGQTHKPAKGNKYRDTAAAAVNALVKMQRADGSFSDGMYAHAIATVALCEAFGMTGDKSLLRKPCQDAITYIQKAQGANGSWGYKAGDQGDTSIVGWQIQALHSAKMCRELKVDANVLKKAMEFLDKVASKPKVYDRDGKEIFSTSVLCGFGYSSPGATPTLSAVGLLCRYYVNGWGPNSAGIRDGTKYLLAAQPPDPKQFDMYYYYYATQVAHFREGEEWHKEWNPKMRDMLVGMQVKNKNKPTVDGSWDPDPTWIGDNCGRLGTTAMAVLTLEVYYRHLPLYNRGTGGKSELDSK